MVKLENVSVSYPQKPVLAGVDLQVPEGCLLVITGPNGSGKSTLLKAIDGLMDRTEGRILFRGEDLLTMDPKERALRVAFLSQNRAVPSITAERLVLHGRFPYLSYPRHYSKEDWAAVHQALETVDALPLAKENLTRMSGGQRQKIYIAMALAQATPLLLMDEPTTFLDISHQLSVMKLAQQLAHEGKTVIMVIHDLRLAMTYADRICICHDGTVTPPKAPEQLIDSPLWESVFGLRLKRFAAGSGWEYYYEKA
ncbi:MAG: ABC transporter ATP-binding protein [Firmicutes bacterium]|nr:ABC transporter ATP-binding protein [Bacillota bacterium]